MVGEYIIYYTFNNINSFCTIKRRKKKASVYDDMLRLSIGINVVGDLIAEYVLTFNIGAQSVSVAIYNIIIATTPIFTALAARIIFNEKN